MNDATKTKSVGENFVKTSGVLLKTSDTALVFFPDIQLSEKN